MSLHQFTHYAQDPPGFKYSGQGGQIREASLDPGLFFYIRNAPGMSIPIATNQFISFPQAPSNNTWGNNLILDTGSTNSFFYNNTLAPIVVDVTAYVTVPIGAAGGVEWAMFLTNGKGNFYARTTMIQGATNPATGMEVSGQLLLPPGNSTADAGLNVEIGHNASTAQTITSPSISITSMGTIYPKSS